MKEYHTISAYPHLLHPRMRPKCLVLDSGKDKYRQWFQYPIYDILPFTTSSYVTIVMMDFSLLSLGSVAWKWYSTRSTLRNKIRCMLPLQSDVNQQCFAIIPRHERDRCPILQHIFDDPRNVGTECYCVLIVTGDQ